jgi:hypothetical protein
MDELRSDKPGGTVWARQRVHAVRRGRAWQRPVVAVLAIAGALLVASGCSDGYDIPPQTGHAADATCLSEPSAGDVCTVDCYPGPNTCASNMGERMCTCEGGVYVQCVCLPPPDWPYDEVPVARYCDLDSGEPRYLINQRCASEGQLCVGAKSPTEGCVCQRTGAQLLWACTAADILGVPPGAPTCESLGSGLHDGMKDKPCDTLWDVCISRNYNPTGTSPRGCLCRMDNPGDTQPTWYCGATNRWWRAP